MNNVRNIEWTEYGQTVLHPVALAILCAMALLFLSCRREYILVPIIIIASFLTHAQRLVLAGIDFSMIRIMIIAGLARMAIRLDYTDIKLNSLDKVMIAYIIGTTIGYTLLWKSSGALINRFGYAVDILGAYFLIRAYITTIRQMEVAIEALAYISVVVATFMFIEQMTQRNLFAVLGGVPAVTVVREGSLRSNGAFSHPIMAGSFGAMLFPLFWGYQALKRNGVSWVFLVGVPSSIVITMTSNSSGPVLALAAGIFAVVMWRYRHHVPMMRRAALFAVVALDIVMEKRVWHLIARIDVVGGSTGYHRYLLIDAAVNRWTEWFAFGVKSTAHWGWGLQDITNMYIYQAVNGGIMSVVLFVVAMIFTFIYVGKTIKAFPRGDARAKLSWSLGAQMFAHAVSFIGVSYFGQMIFFYIMTIGFSAAFYVMTAEKNPKIHPSDIRVGGRVDSVILD